MARSDSLIIERRYAEPDDLEAQEVVVRALLWLLERPHRDEVNKGDSPKKTTNVS